MSETWGWFDGPRKRYYNQVALGVIKFLFPEGSVWWDEALIILAVGAMLSNMLTITVINMLDNGLTIQTDTFVAVMPFATSHMLSPFYYSIIDWLYGAASNLSLLLMIYAISAILVDMTRYGISTGSLKADDEL